MSISVLFLIFYSAKSQESSPELQIPSSPGMNIIGVQNAEITKPGNYTGIYTNLISPILSNNGTIPTDLAVEFSPFYLESRDITWKEIDKTNVYRDLRISIASNSVLNSDSILFSRLGIGFRTNLMGGKINNIDQKKIKLSMPAEINTTIMIIESEIYGSIDTADVKKITEKITYPSIKLEVIKIIEDNRNNKQILLAKLKKLNKTIDDLVEVDGSRQDYSLRTGHFLEIAGAFALDFPNNTIDYSEINRWGIWLNYTYRPSLKNTAIDIGAIVRISNYSFDPTIIFDSNSGFIDYGISFNWKITKTKFIFSGELIGKAGFSDFKATENENEFDFKGVTESKWNFSIGYQITPNTLWSFSFSDINGNSDYLNNNTLQFLMGLSAALAPLEELFHATSLIFQSFWL